MPKSDLQVEWDQQLQALFNGAIPESAEWTAPGEIVTVLRAIAGKVNHVFLPTRGGMDLADCRVTRDGLLEWGQEEGRLDRHAYVCKPERLVFWNPGSSTREANFILEVGALDPVDPERDEQQSRKREEVVELAPNDYAPRWAWDEQEYQGAALPGGARLLNRDLVPGRFAIFGKGSIYNGFRGQGFDAYGAVHNDPVTFRNIVEQMASIEDDQL